MDGTGVVRREIASVEGVGHLCAWNGCLRGLPRCFPDKSVLMDHSRRSSQTNSNPPTFPSTPFLCWPSLERDFHDQQTGAFSGCRRMSGCWWKSAGAGSQVPGLAPQIPWSSSRPLLVTGSPQLLKLSRTSVPAGQPTQTLPQ